MFLYYTIHRIKTQASCVFSRILAHKPYQNANPTHSVIWVLYLKPPPPHHTTPLPSLSKLLDPPLCNEGRYHLGSEL